MPSHCNVRSCSDRLKQLLLPCFSFRFTNYFTSNAMSSAWSASTSSAATERGTGPLLQSTAGANIIFINIDWKRSRHTNPASTKRNLTVLANTTSSIVTNMKPAVICCCEAGTAMSPMTREQMSAMAHAMRKAWEEAATERPAISFLFEDDAPYLTIWDDNRCKCTHGRILKNVYNVPRQRRHAQAFLCTLPGEGDEEGMDVVNVHAPSGDPKLTDKQRFQLMRNLLQSSSMTRANRPIGEGRFLIGGDMNTDEVPLGQILNKLQDQGILKTNVEVMVPLDGKHGDICVVGGFTTTMAQERAVNHDPQHVPYGIAWRKQPQHATEQLTTTPQTQIPTAPDTTTKSKATGAAAAAVPTGATAAAVPKQTQPGPKVVAVPKRQLSQLALQKASASACLATEQPDEPDSSRRRRRPRTTRHATEQSHPTHADETDSSRRTPTQDEHEAPQPNRPGQEMSYVIVNAFLNNVTFESTEAERLIKGVIHRTGDSLNIDEVFQPIFFNYPNGLNDRTRVEPRNPSPYIREWRDIAAWRQRYLRPAVPIGPWRQTAGAGAPQHATEQLAKPQVNSILHEYIDNFIRNEADHNQKKQRWTRNKCRAEARLRRLCGSVMMAKVIWEVGLPNISEAGFAMEKVLPDTEQQRPLEQDVQDSIATATETILNWLSTVATSIQEHKATPTYQEHARKSGTQKNKSGLTEIELSAKKEKMRAARLKYGSQPSTASRSDTWQTPAQWQWQRHGQ